MAHLKRSRPANISEESRAVARRSESAAGASKSTTAKRGSDVAGQLVGFGKHKWLTFQQLAEQQHDYCAWILEHTAPSDQMRRLQEFLRQRQPSSPSASSTSVPTSALMPSWVQRILDKGNIMDALESEVTPVWSGFKPERVKLLHRYQREAIACAIERGGRILLADEMGLGKTVQALAIAANYLEEWPVLIVAPATLRFVWQVEIKKWLASARTQVVTGSSARFNPSSNIFIVSYDLIARCEHLQKPPCGGEFQVIICDESHYFKNATSQRAQALVPMLKRARRAVLISGTPILNGAFEVYPQLDALIPNAIPAPMAFAQRYCEIEDQKFGHGAAYTGVVRSQELTRVLATVMIRRHKAEVLKELPPKRWRVVPVEVAAGPGSGQALAWRGDPEKAYTQGCSWFAKAWEGVGRSKTPFAVEYTALLLDGLPATEKLLIFAHHHAVLDGLEEKLRALHPGRNILVRIDGKTPQAQRQQIVCRFQEDPQVRVALLSVHCCAHGLTLTAATCIVFAELYCVPAVMMQAEDRAHRVGQQRCVDIHYLVAHRTVDDTIMNALERKCENVGDVLLAPAVKERQTQVSAASVVSPSVSEETLGHLVAMGFDSVKACAAVRRAGGGIEDAVELLQKSEAPKFKLGRMDRSSETGTSAGPAVVPSANNEAVAQLVAMGFNAAEASAALLRAGGHIEDALDILQTPDAVEPAVESTDQSAAQLVMMGFDADAAAAALHSAAGQFDGALELLLSAKGGA